MNRVLPSYPPLARPLNLTGTVKLEALVAPEGTVKTMEIKGGNPVFARAAETALREWKWEKSGQWTTEVVEFDFKP
ncbi:MAG: energy transducer TonB [Acidobacteria bacterium]|nr:energy transducer TonB [Acidobacteriota bacterium]